MKKILCACLLACAACDKNDRPLYDDSYSALNIWLGRQAVASDSIVYNFAYQSDFDSIVFYVRLTGFPATADRSFELAPVEGDSALVHYRTPTYVLPAGTYQAAFPIYINKPEGYSAFKEKSGRLVFKVKENPAFREGATETSRLRVVFRNAVGKPDNWDVATSPYRTLASVFGAYSDAKYSFIIQVTGRSNFKIYYTTVPGVIEQLADDEVTLLEATDMKNRCKLALIEYNAERGDLLDENNEKVVFP
ncbi:MAG: DUF4843 domain-containing protein [Odoribacteraceae bacterium]|jgi:hypothetical protein|nr:DUF4843 domain-containing protein [Odoribacteraceae bacterium]